MKRKVLAMLLTAAMAVSLMACGSGGDAAKENTEPAAGTEADAPAEETGSDETDGSEQAEAPASDEGGSDYGGITLTFLNSKPEITDAFKKVTSAWGDAHGVTFEITETSNPNDTLMANYQSAMLRFLRLWTMPTYWILHPSICFLWTARNGQSTRI